MMISIPCTVGCSFGGCEEKTEAEIQPSREYESSEYGSCYTGRYYFDDSDVLLHAPDWATERTGRGGPVAYCPKHKFIIGR